MKTIEVLPNDIFTETHRILLTGGRMIGIFCIAHGTSGETGLKYLFHMAEDLICLEIRVRARGTVQSVSSLCGAAVYYENEIRDMIGIFFEGLEQDYGRRFFLAGEAIESEVE